MLLDSSSKAATHDLQVNHGRTHVNFLTTETKAIVFGFMSLVLGDQRGPAEFYSACQNLRDTLKRIVIFLHFNFGVLKHLLFGAPLSVSPHGTYRARALSRRLLSRRLLGLRILLLLGLLL